MPRPNRLYTIDGKYYYIKDGKKVFVKVPAGVSQKQVSKINIKNIIKLAESKRVVRKKKRRNLSYQKKIAPALQKSETGGLPIYFFKPKKEIPTLEEQAKASDDTNVEKLAKLLLKDAKFTPSSSKLPTEPTIATPAKPSPEPPTEEKKPKPNKGGIATRIARVFQRKGKITKEDVRGEYPGQELSTPLLESALKKAQETRPALQTPSGVNIKSGAKQFFNPLSRNNRVAPTPQRLTFDEMQTLYPSERIGEDDGGVSESKGNGYGSSDGLYDDEIETIAKKRLRDFIPVIAKDETDQLMKYIKRGDKQFGFVINTDNSDQPGRHWRCVYINNMDDYPSIEYFDPLTEGKPEQSLIDICRKIAIKMNSSKLFKYKQNMIRRQSKLTSNCGYHCIHFLEGRYIGIPFSEITGYDQFVEDMKKQHGELDGSGSGEKEILPYMKKYDSYI
jgi:hypothetical protein